MNKIKIIRIWDGFTCNICKVETQDRHDHIRIHLDDFFESIHKETEQMVDLSNA